MSDETCRLFERVAQKMGWFDQGLEETEEKVCVVHFIYLAHSNYKIFIFP